MIDFRENASSQQPDTFQIREGCSRMVFSAVPAMLAAAHWSRHITEEEVRKASANSALVIGAFLPDGEQIGFARVVSDKVRFAYLMDVIIREDQRSSGAGEQLVRTILSHPELSDVYQWMLVTTYAHSFYEKCGFVRTRRADNLMELLREPPHR